MAMNLNPANIDFILVNYFSEDYAKIAVESIYKFTKSPFNVLLIDNSNNKKLLRDTFKDFTKDNLYIINGYNQETPEERFSKEIKMYPTIGGIYGPGSLHHNKALNMGIDLCKSKYICHVDIDSLFLNYWEGDILPLLEDNLFVSHGESKGIAREYFMIWEKSKFENYNLRPDLSYVDTCGNLTLFCKENDIDYYICSNTMSLPNKASIHQLPIESGTESYLPNNLPFHYHLGRGTSLKAMGQGEFRTQYINLSKNYLYNNET